jgi:hypothetical protein
VIGMMGFLGGTCIGGGTKVFNMTTFITLNG